MASRTRFDDRPIRERNKSLGQVIAFDYAQMSCKLHHQESSAGIRTQKTSGENRLNHEGPSVAEHATEDSEYIPQRRKGRKENSYPNLALLAPWREKFPSPGCFL